MSKDHRTKLSSSLLSRLATSSQNHSGLKYLRNIKSERKDKDGKDKDGKDKDGKDRNGEVFKFKKLTRTAQRKLDRSAKKSAISYNRNLMYQSKRELLKNRNNSESEEEEGEGEEIENNSKDIDQDIDIDIEEPKDKKIKKESALTTLAKRKKSSSNNDDEHNEFEDSDIPTDEEDDESNEPEKDQEIRRLEKKLGIKSNSNKENLLKELAEDGLDDLFDLVSYTSTDYALMASQPHLKKLLEEEDWDGLDIAVKEYKRKEKLNKKKVVDDELKTLKKEKKEKSKKIKVENKMEVKEQELEDQIETLPAPLKVEEVVEVKKYVPPSKRANATAVNSTPASIQLKKKIHNLINKMAESNMDSIATEIGKLYKEHPRGEINALLADIVIAACSDESILLASLLLCSSALITNLHAVIGFEIGAYFIERVVKELDPCSKYHIEGSINENVDFKDSRKFSNLTLFITYFYNFKVIEDCGSQLRKEDPGMLKEMVAAIQECVKPYIPVINQVNANITKPLESSVITKAISMRVRFMLDTITDIKNNTSKNADLVERLAGLVKWVFGTTKKNNCDIRRLQFSFSDIISADTTGRWWLVGAAYAGQETNQSVLKTLQSFESSKTQDVERQALLKKARDMGMNTDVRKALFLIVMNSADFMDAFEKIARLSLKAKQDRDVVRVILECCAHEAKFNPYYGFLANRLCEFEKNYKKSFQVAVWDWLKKIDDSSPRIVANVSKFVFGLMKSRNESILTIKSIEWTQFSKSMLLFLHVLFTEIFGCDLDFIKELFTPLSTKDEFLEARTGVVYYLTTYFIPTLSKSNAFDPDEVRKRFRIIKKSIEPASDFGFE